MKKERSHLSAGKKLGILFLVIALFFTVINVFWLISVNLPYSKYCRKLDKTEEDGMIYYEKTVDDYFFTVKRPGYMDFTGYLTVGDKNGSWININESGEITGSSELYIELNIIPDVWGNFRYRLWFSDEQNDIDYFVFIDKDYNYLPSKTATDKVIATKSKIVKDNMDEIKRLMTAADTMWEIR